VRICGFAKLELETQNIDYKIFTEMVCVAEHSTLAFNRLSFEEPILTAVFKVTLRPQASAMILP
jgi:hypothetical protein